LALPMGWTSSPPLFCTTTETITNLANSTLCQGSLDQLPHHLKEAANPCWNDGIYLTTHNAPPATPLPTTSTTRPLTWANVFVNDHVVLAQGTPGHLQQVHQTLLHSIDRVFRLLAAQDRHTRQEPISCKKLATGDGQWSTHKTVLGWHLDTKALTLTLPPHRAARLQELLETVPCHRSRIATKQWHQLLGELCSMVLALPRSHGLFSMLQEAFRHRDSCHRL